MSWAAPHWVALGVFALAWMAVEFSWNFFPIPERLCEGHSLAKLAEEGYLVSILPGGKHFPLLPEGSPRGALAPPTPVLIRVESQKSLTEPKGFLTTWGAWESLEKEK